MALWIAELDVMAMQREAQAFAPKETGGVLVGYRARNTEMVVTAVVGPGPNATHELERFIPDTTYQQDEISRLYADSGRMVEYLGDWHSHPGHNTQLSPQDVRTLRSIAAAPQARQPEPIMVILGPRVPWAFAVWQWRRCRLPMRSPVISLQSTVFKTEGALPGPCLSNAWKTWRPVQSRSSMYGPLP